MSLAPGPHPFAAVAPPPDSSTLTRLVARAAEELGIRLLLEPEFGYCGCLERAGKRLHFKGNVLDLNAAGASSLSRDKGYSIGLMLGAGVPVPRSLTVFAPSFERFAERRGAEAAAAFAAELGYPVFVKPNEGSQAYGASRVDRPGDLFAALERSFKLPEGRVTLVQEHAAGVELRVIVLDGRALIGYRKERRIIEPDGRPVALLLDDFQSRHWGRLGKTRRAPLRDDLRVLSSLKRQGLSLESVPVKPFLLSDGLSLGVGHEARILEELSEEVQSVAVGAVGAVGLRWGSADMIVTETGALVLEVNSAPGLTTLAALGHEERVVGVYRELITAFFG